MIIRNVLAVVFTSAALAGCSSSGGTASAPPTTAAPTPIAAGTGVCGYLTEADMHPLADQVKFPGRKTDDFDYGPSCDYGGAVFSLITPDVSPKAFSYGATKTVSNLGDEAYFSAEVHWLRVAKGKTRFQLQCRLCPPDELGALTAVAKAVVARLPG